MNVVSLFSGVGGFDLALERVGFTVTTQVEIDPFCQRVLALRWPGTQRVGRVEAYAREPRRHDRPVDLLVGGFPCQDISVAGQRAGLDGERSGLFFEYVRVAQALTPTWGIVENVPGLASSGRFNGSDFALILQGLRQCWPVVGYRTLDSQYFGVPQRRRRLFFVGGPTAHGVAAVLALFDGGGGDPAARGETGARVAGTLTGGARGGRSHGKQSGSDRGELIFETRVARNGRGAPESVAPPLKAQSGRTGKGDSAPMVFKPSHYTREKDGAPNTIVPPLSADADKGDQDPLVLAMPTPGESPDIADPISAHEGKTYTHEGKGNFRLHNVVAPGIVQQAISAKWAKQSSGPSGDEHHHLVAYDTTQITSTKNWSNPQPGDPCHPLAQTMHPPLIAAATVRRLTPLECERLQGFPDGWSCLCSPLEAYAADPDAAALACRCKDTPRYRALGNAVTVPVVFWIAQRLRQWL